MYLKWKIPAPPWRNRSAAKTAKAKLWPFRGFGEEPQRVELAATFLSTTPTEKSQSSDCAKQKRARFRHGRSDHRKLQIPACGIGIGSTSSVRPPTRVGVASPQLKSPSGEIRGIGQCGCRGTRREYIHILSCGGNRILGEIPRQGLIGASPRKVHRA